MARIAGVNIPENKHLEIALTHIYGIGKKTAQDICNSVKLDYSKKVSDLSEDQVETLGQLLQTIQSKVISADQLVQTSKDLWILVVTEG